MIIVCQTCSTRFQLDEEKSPRRPLSIRCPKCQSMLNASIGSPASEQGALSVGGSPSTGHPRYEHVPTAPTYQLDTATAQGETSTADEAIRMLADLLGKGSKAANSNVGTRSQWNKRKVLLCASEKHRELTARSLAENGYTVYVAEDTRQAIETMREKQVEVVLLEQEFDMQEQGAAFVVREINILQPSLRRRVFFVLVSPSLRTMDSHSAFLNNLNAVVNVNDLEGLPRILEVGLREYNELYREFNVAFNLTAL